MDFGEYGLRPEDMFIRKSQIYNLFIIFLSRQCYKDLFQILKWIDAQ